MRTELSEINEDTIYRTKNEIGVNNKKIANDDNDDNDDKVVVDEKKIICNEDDKKCAPSKTFENQSCYSLNFLIKMAKKYNETSKKR